MTIKFSLSNYGKALIRFTSSQLISNFLKLISGFLVVRLIDPETYGQFTGFGIFIGYFVLGQGGIIHGLSRELPFEYGRKNDTYGHKLATSVYVLTLAICFLASIFYLCLAIYYFNEGNIMIALICLGYVIIGGLDMLNNLFLPTLYRTSNEFKSLGNQNILLSITAFSTIIFVYYFSIYGLILRAVSIAIIDFILKFKNKPFKLSFQFHFDHMKVLFKTGFPIFITSQVALLWLTLVNNAIFTLGGAVNYGLFGLSNIVKNSLGVIPRSISQMVFPHMTMSYGKGISVSTILKSNIKPLIFQFIIVLLISIVGCYLLPIVIPIVLPNYIGGISAAQWIIFIPVVQSFSPLNSIYPALNKLKFLFWSYTAGAVIGSLFIFLKFRIDGFHLEYFAQGLLLGGALQQFFALLLIKKVIKHDNKDKL